MAATRPAQMPDIRQRMARMYQPQKYIYDLTRKYYLLGRDRLIEELSVRPGQSLLDIGCGTGRNLVLIARRWPGAQLYGLDAAEPMLTIAAAKLARRGVTATLAHGVAERLDPPAMFHHAGGFDHITISYCLSMVDDPETALRAAARHLAPGGALHVVDFGDMSGLPAWSRRALTGWLSRFHVRYRPEVGTVLAELGNTDRFRYHRVAIAGGYAFLERLTPA